MRRQSVRSAILIARRRQCSQRELPAVLRIRPKISIVNSIQFLDLLRGSTKPEECRSKLERLLPSPDVDVNVKLMTIMVDGSDQDIFQFIVKNIESTLNNSKLEAYVVSLIQKGYLTAATSMLHVLFAKQPEFVLSHEAWSILLTKVSEQSHYEGAKLIFHEIIDNFRYYDENHYTTFLDNNMIPFLIQPTYLENLAALFGTHGDTMTVRGLLEYFKRFYSYVAYWWVYKTILINMVECYSKEGSFQDAMEWFNVLAFRCNDKQSLSEHSQELLKYRAKLNAKVTRDNIRDNRKLEGLHFPEDIQSSNFLDQQISASKESLSLFYPHITSNLYTVAGRNEIRIFQDAFEADDLPQFQTLITSRLQALKDQSKTDLQSSIESISYKQHYILQRFLVISLCDIDCHIEAGTVLTNLAQKFPSVGKNKIYHHSVFAYFFKTLYYKITSLQSNADTLVVSRLSIIHQDITDLFLRVSHGFERGHSAKIYGFILQSMVMIPNAPFERMQRVITKWRRHCKEHKIHLEPTAYDMLKEQCTKHEALGVLLHVVKIE